MESQGQRPCPDQRERLVAVAGGDARQDFALDAHLMRCAGCSAWLARVERHVDAMRNLARIAVPQELDGRTVAATQAGFRQDRVVGALRELSPIGMPSEVDHMIWPTGKSAPPVLDRLVDNDLQEQTRGIARRFAGRIERLSAPRSLDARVRATWNASQRRSERRWVALAAAMLLVVLGVTSTLYLVGRRANRPLEPQIVIERVASPADLDPALQHAFALVLGGAPDAQVQPW